MAVSETIKREMIRIAGEANVLSEEPLKAHTSFRIGGPASLFVMPETQEEILEILGVLRASDTPHFILGNGSNLLAADEGYDGVVVQIGKRFAGIRTEGTVLYASAGALLSQIAVRAMEASLSGFVFASGIPGTLGGACIMNAGAYGGEMKDVLRTVRVLLPDGTLRDVPAEEMELGYRSSGFARRGEIVLSAELLLTEGDANAIRAEMEELAALRREKQPLSLPSAGSTFKRPEGYFAGKLISDAGLKGYRIGGAEVSQKHAGFIVNTGNATAADVRALIGYIQDTVEREYGVRLETEVRFLGTVS